MILIVDSDQTAAASLERMLKYNGFSVVTVLGAMEALTLLEMHKPKVIVLELETNGTRGMLLLKAIRSDASFENVPILINTSNFDDAVRQEAMRSGAQDFVVKGTLGWAALLDRVRTLYRTP